MLHYSDALLSFIKNNLHLESKKAIAREFAKANPDLNISVEGAAKRAGELMMTHGLKLNKAIFKNVKIKDVIQEDKRIIKLKESNVTYKRKYEETIRELEKLNRKLEVVLNVKKEPIQYYGIPFKLTNDSQSTAIALASDWHLGEVVEPATVNQLNTFCYSIGIKRIQKFFQSILKLVEIERNGTQIDTLVLALLGDFITGYIHEELMENADLSPTEAIIELRNLIHSGIRFLKDEGSFSKIIIPTCFGNHGRTTIRKRHSTAYKNSYEYLLYKILEADYLKDNIVEFRVGSGYHNWLTIYDKYDLRFHHGDDIMYNGGVGGLTIPANKAIAQWNKSRTAYMDFFGHFHTFFDGGNFITNGSIIGYNAYALSIKASFEEPKQTLTIIEKDRGKTATRPIFVTEKK